MYPRAKIFDRDWVYTIDGRFVLAGKLTSSEVRWLEVDAVDYRDQAASIKETVRVASYSSREHKELLRQRMIRFSAVTAAMYRNKQWTRPANIIVGRLTLLEIKEEV